MSLCFLSELGDVFTNRSIGTRILSHGHVLVSVFPKEADHKRTVRHFGRFRFLSLLEHNAVKQGFDTLVSICPRNEFFNREKVLLLLFD